MNELLAYRIGVPLARILPRPLTAVIAHHWSGILFKRDHQARRAVTNNLRQVFHHLGREPGHDVLEGIARKTFEYFGSNLVDFFRYAGLSMRDIKRFVSLENLQYLDEAKAAGRGVILASAHYGNWELGGSVLATLGYPVNTVALPQRMDALNRLFSDQRARHGMKAIPLDHSLVGLVKCLKRGEVVALLSDRDFSGSGVEVAFFGRRVRLPRGPAWLARKLGAPIVPVFVPRLPDHSYLLKCCPPIWPDGQSRELDLQMKIAGVLENEIGAHPHQWCVFEDFWKTYGPGESAA